jgi:hypothetical protein
MTTAITDLDRLLISDQLRDLMARYARHADHQEWDNLAALFINEGTFTPLNVAGQPIAHLEGREAIKNTLSGSISNTIAIHHLFSYEVQVSSPDRATGLFAMEDYLFKEGEVGDDNQEAGLLKPFRTMHGYGHYKADFIRIDNAWYISRLVQTRLKLDFTH